MEAGDDPLAVGHDEALVLDHVIGGKPTAAFADAHRPARQMDPDPNADSTLHLVIEPGASGPQIGVVGGGRTARQRKLGQRNHRRNPDMIGGDPAPNGIEGREPLEEVRVLSAGYGPGQGLGEVMVGIDQTGEEQVTGQVDHLVGGIGQQGRRTDLLDPPVAGEHGAVGYLGAALVHRHQQRGVAEQQRPHGRRRYRDHMTLGDHSIETLSERLRPVIDRIAARYPGESERRQPVHTVYGGAHLFRAGTAPKLGELARKALQTYAPNGEALGAALGMAGGGDLPARVYQRVVDKLEREPVEDFRLDFEDGYGNRPDDEEDGHARSAAAEVATAVGEGTAPPFIGIRIKPFSADLHRRSLRTLDIFMTTLVEQAGGFDQMASS